VGSRFDADSQQTHFSRGGAERQKKTSWPVRFQLTEQTRQAVDDYIQAAGKKADEFLFSGRDDRNRCMTTRVGRACGASAQIRRTAHTAGRCPRAVPAQGPLSK
jgi:hypothetical protein